MPTRRPGGVHAARRARCAARRVGRRTWAKARAHADVLGYSLIVDDVVRPDGATFMGKLGGGGPQALFGARVFDAAHDDAMALGLCAKVGSDIPFECLKWLSDLEVDLQLLAIDPAIPTPRAWQVCELDGRRTQVWRTAHGEQQVACLRPEWQEGTSTRAIHVGIDVEHPPWGVLERARESGALVSVETFKPAASPLPRDHLRKLADAVDFLSPNLVEARAMLGADASEADAPAAARLLADAGVPHAIVRAGASGAAWACPDGSLWHAPSVSGISVVDDTGCGNAHCGAVLAAFLAHHAPASCLSWGASAASLILEHVGVPPAATARLRRDDARSRAAAVASRVTSAAALPFERGP